MEPDEGSDDTHNTNVITFEDISCHLEFELWTITSGWFPSLISSPIASNSSLFIAKPRQDVFLVEYAFAHRYLTHSRAQSYSQPKHKSHIYPMGLTTLQACNLKPNQWMWW